jgi:aspartate racemase
MRMKTMGLLAGMSWESSSVYYQLINRQVQRRLGGVHSAKALIYSFDFGEISRLQQSARWDEASALLSGVGRTLAAGGADFLAICCNTMHLMAADVEQASGIPLLHIADPLGKAAKKAGMTKLGLLGTRFTMDEPRIIADRLRTKFGLDVIVPDAPGREIVDGIIQTELVKGIILESSRGRYRAVMADLVKQGCQAIILGCTEIPLLVSQADASVPLYDTMQLHAAAIVDFALA